MKRIHCHQCGGHDIRRESDKTLYCGYCGNRYFSASDDNTRDGTAAPARLKPALFAAGLSGLLILLIAAAAVFYFVNDSLPPAKPGSRSASGGEARPLVEGGPGSIEAEKKASAEVIKLKPVPDTIGNIYFIGFIRNTGETVIKPVAELVLSNENYARAAVATGYAPRQYLLPGEETPVMILVQKAPRYTSLKTIPGVDYPMYYRLRPELRFHELKLKRPKSKFDRYELTGRVENVDTFPGTHVQLIGVLLDREGMPGGMASVYLGQKTLAPGDNAPFRIDFYTSRGIAESFVLDYSALSDVSGEE